MNPLASWLTYLRLRREDGGWVAAPDFYWSLALALIFCLAWLSIGMPNSFSKDGLVDGLGSLTTVLAGFFVAGLVAIATFFRENSSLDDVIDNGPAILNFGLEEQEYLTRRQYVCSIFGFLVGISFFLAISSVISQSFSRYISGSITGSIILGELKIDLRDVAEIFAISAWMFLFVLQVILALRGIYYLMDRMYDVKIRLGRPKGDQKAGTEDPPT